MQLPIKTVVALILVAAVLIAIVSFFLFGIKLSPLDSRKVFSQGCVTYCNEISAEASKTGNSLEAVAQKKAEQLESYDFARACSQLYPDTSGYTYLCWIRNCCSFELPPP